MRRLVLWRVPIWTYIFALLGIVGIYILTTGLYSVITASVPDFVKIDTGFSLLLFAFYILVLGGPLGEEIGWRGYLQPQLQEKFSPMTTSFIIGAVWTLWHIPLFWLEGAAQQGGSIPDFVISVFAMAFIFTWLYIQTKGSLFLAILFHTSINFFSALVLPSILPLSASDRLYGMLFNAFLLLTAAVLVILFKKSYLKKSPAK